MCSQLSLFTVAFNAEYHCTLVGTKEHCFITEAYACEQVGGYG